MWNTRTLLVVLVCGCGASALGQPAPIPSETMLYPIETGPLDASPLALEAEVVYATVIAAPAHAPWLRIEFGDCQLGEHSFILMRALQDSGWQRLDTRYLDIWNHASAYFRGDQVLLELHAAPGEQGLSLTVAQIEFGVAGNEGAISTLCGGDDRVAASDARIGRIRGVGCTGWLISNGAHLTAGHCAAGSMTVLEFNVPPSTCSGAIVPSDPNDQYPVIGASVQFVDGGRGDDWCVFDCGPNSNTGLTPIRAQQSFFRVSRDSIPTQVRITGYGIDNTPVGCTLDRNEDSQTEQTSTGPFQEELFENANDIALLYECDTERGNSGSPVQWPGTDISIGIHTHGTCEDPDALTANWGTSFEHATARATINAFPGAGVRYVDAGHLVTLEDGTVFRPYDVVSEGVSAVPAGGILSIATGTYTQPQTITKAMTIQAPVGSVVIR